MDTFVKLENITKIYHMGEVEIRAVDGIDFSIQKGEFVVIVGPSGAGKTTVLNILGGMDTASGGRITVDGQDITKYSERQLTGYRRDDIGFVFQFYNLIPNLFRHSFQGVSSREFLSQELWLKIQSFFCVMSRPERWIIIPERRS